MAKDMATRSSMMEAPLVAAKVAEPEPEKVSEILMEKAAARRKRNAVATATRIVWQMVQRVGGRLVAVEAAKIHERQR